MIKIHFVKFLLFVTKDFLFMFTLTADVNNLRDEMSLIGSISLLHIKRNSKHFTLKRQKPILPQRL